MTVIVNMVLLTGLLLYGAAVTYMYVQQDDLVFPQTVNDITLARDGSYQKLTLTMPGGVNVQGIYLPDANDPTAPLVLAFGGNAHDVTGFAHFLKYKVYTDRAAQVAGVSYRGYPNALGVTSEGTPTQEKIYADALEIYDQLTQQHRPRAVHVIGYSLGTAVATHVANNREIASLALVAPFTSILELAQKHYPWLPVRSLMQHPLRVEGPLKQVTVPVSLFHAAQDGLIPATHRSRVAAAARHLKQEHVLQTTHADILNEPEIRPLLRNAW